MRIVPTPLQKAQQSEDLQVLIGYDIALREQRNAAIANALDTTMGWLTAGVVLVSGFVMVHPGANAGATEAAQSVGWLWAADDSLTTTSTPQSATQPTTQPETESPQSTPAPVAATPQGGDRVTLIDHVVGYMESKGYELYRGDGEINIVYVEAMDPDGNTINDDDINGFNDLRIIFEFVDDSPKITGIWRATTTSSSSYTYQPMNPKGAARIVAGQYKAWQVGVHNGHHEALIQTGGPVMVQRDWNKNGRTPDDPTESGHFGINQHGGYDMPLDDVGPASAGCLVGQSMRGQKDFMRAIKESAQYQADSKYVFTTTVLRGPEVLNHANAN